jgi:hypothetical protein
VRRGQRLHAADRCCERRKRRGRDQKLVALGRSRTAGHALTRKGVDVQVGLDRLQEIELEQDGKRFRLRTPTTGVAGKLFQAVGVALPPNLQELARTTPQPAA